MNESSVTAERGINSGIRSSEVEIVDTDDLHEGGFGIVKRVLAILRRSSSSRERTHAIPMVYKRYHSLNKPEDAEILRNIPRVYQLLRDLNSPDLKVVPTLRITVDGLLMTDVSEGGKNEIISNNQVASIRDRRAYIASLIERKPSMARFMSEINEAEILTKCVRISVALAQKRIVPHKDVFSLVIKPSGQLDIYALDLDQVKVYGQDESFNPEFVKENLIKFYALIKIFLDDLRTAVQAEM